MQACEVFGKKNEKDVCIFSAMYLNTKVLLNISVFKTHANKWKYIIYVHRYMRNHNNQ